jgi:hypothetical protein
LMTRYLNKRNQFLILPVVLLFLVIFASACQMREKGRKPSADWSRSVPLGVFVRGDIDLVVSPDGTSAHLVWLMEEEGQNIVHYVQLDQSAVTQIARNLDLPPGQMRSPQLAPAGGSNLHLFWSNRPEGERQWDLWYGRLNEAGELEGEARLLAPAADNVDQFVKVSDGQGGVYVAWEARANGALYGTHIDAGGQLVQERVLLTERGQNPSLAAAGSQLFMTWIVDYNVYYGQMPAGELSEVEGAQITTISLSDAIALDGPVLGLSGDWAYVIWGIFNIRGLESGTGTMEYLAFPKESPTRGNGEWLKISPAEEQPYAPYDSAYRITQLAPPAETADSTDVVREPFLTTGRGNELAVAAVINQDFRLDTITQVGIILFADGEFTGYQMAGKTDAFSQEPALATDGEGNLYIAWREGGQGSLAYYALTKPEVRGQLDRMEANDVANVALNGGIELISGILFFPLACVWLFPGLFLIGLYHFWRGESDLNEPATIVILVIAIVVSQVMKFLFLPTITTYIPFSAWLDVSSNWEEPLRYIVPLFTMGIGLLVAWGMHRRTHSGIAFFFWFMATDAILTLAIYGVTIWGVS